MTKAQLGVTSVGGSKGRSVRSDWSRKKGVRLTDVERTESDDLRPEFGCVHRTPPKSTALCIECEVIESTFSSALIKRIRWVSRNL